MSDRIAVMFDGRIAQLASPQDLYRHPINRQVASFIGVMNFLDAQLTAEQGDRLALYVAALGKVEIPRSQAPGGVNGGKISVGVRPEMLTILYEDSDRAQNEVEGEIVEANYFGDMTYYDVRLPGVEALATVSMRNTAGRRC